MDTNAILGVLSDFERILKDAIPQEVKDNIRGAEKNLIQVDKNVATLIAKVHTLATIVENYNKRGLSSITGDVVKQVREGTINKDEAMAKIQSIMDSILPTEKAEEKPEEVETQPESKTKTKKDKKLPEVKPSGSAE